MSDAPTPRDVLQAAIVDQNLYHGRYGTVPAGGAAAAAILSALHDQGYALTRHEPLDVERLAEWLNSSEGRIEDIFGLWTQGMRTSQWVAERLIDEGHLARLEADR